MSVHVIVIKQYKKFESHIFFVAISESRKNLFLSASEKKLCRCGGSYEKMYEIADALDLFFRSRPQRETYDFL